MDKVKELRPPLSQTDVLGLKAGDEVVISGSIYTARDMAHKRLCKAIELNEKLPIELEGAVIYFVGPTPARPGKVIGSAGPTTSGRMDSFSPKLIEKGLKAMIGKGYRNSQVREVMKKYGAVHLAALGGAGALLSKYIVASKVVAYDDLGTESIRELIVERFPAVVAYDAYGNSIYDK